LASADEKNNQGNKKNKSVKFAFFMLFVTMFVFLPTTVLFAVCLVPTIVAWVVDNNINKTIWITVGAMNFAGTIPAWFRLWDMGHNIANAIIIILQPTTILVSYGGAAVGWFIYINITPFIASIIVMKNEARLSQIDKRVAELLRKWGPEVTGKAFITKEK